MCMGFCLTKIVLRKKELGRFSEILWKKKFCIWGTNLLCRACLCSLHLVLNLMTTMQSFRLIFSVLILHQQLGGSLNTYFNLFTAITLS